mgnify:CR=1 FL=1
MAAIVARFIEGYDVDVIYVVGGACSFKKFEVFLRRKQGLRRLSRRTFTGYSIRNCMNCNKQEKVQVFKMNAYKNKIRIQNAITYAIVIGCYILIQIMMQAAM